MYMQEQTLAFYALGGRGAAIICEGNHAKTYVTL